MEAQSNQDRTGAFWNRYRGALAARGLRGKAAEWCVKRAEGFIKAAKGLRLKEHTAEDLRAYFCRQAMGGWLKDWQYGQMVEALRVLFTEIVKSPWASEFPWDEWKTEQSYQKWPLRFITFHGDRAPEGMGANKVRAHSTCPRP
jgi:hypothetical protein